ncbi:MAG: hypothetical protein LC656_08235 [Sphingomonadales bacterium]|nr:hypothetical protein [Sphingomonadales bacterium]
MTAPAFWAQKERSTMEKEKKLSSSQKKKASESEGRMRKPPPDPDGHFRTLAARGKKVITLYEKLNLGAEKNELVWFLLLDLMHLCDRHPAFGDFENACIYSSSIYDGLVEENKLMARK